MMRQRRAARLGLVEGGAEAFQELDAAPLQKGRLQACPETRLVAGGAQASYALPGSQDMQLVAESASQMLRSIVEL
jgi:hypothetical protein